MELKIEKLFCKLYVLRGIQSTIGLRPTVNTTLITTSVTLSFKAKTRCSLYVCPGSSCHTYGQNVNIENQCLYDIVSYYKNLLQVQKGISSGKRHHLATGR
jgi:hypothetical protein